MIFEHTGKKNAVPRRPTWQGQSGYRAGRTDLLDGTGSADRRILEQQERSDYGEGKGDCSKTSKEGALIESYDGNSDPLRII